MARKDIIIMTRRDLKRLHVIHKMLDKELKQIEVAELLQLSDRQIRRITKRIRQEGSQGIIHRSRGQPSHHAMDAAIKEKVKKIYQIKYHGFGPTLASEKLFAIDKIKIGDETLRLWLLRDGLWHPVRKHRTHRQWRERRHRLGEMIQMDGSHHDWLEGRGPWLILLGYIDDATSRVFARFYEYEGVIPAMDSFKRYIQKYGIPRSLYVDNHSTYKSQAKPTIEDELNNQQPLSEFERALNELGVDVIHAHSPQAKGRVERLFKTLQDRLVKELRLDSAKDIGQANACLEAYLPQFNSRFSRQALKHGNLHRPAPGGLILDTILCIRTTHPIRNDATIVHQKQWYQILDKTYVRHVLVQERVDGRMHITHKGRSLRYKLLVKRPEPTRDIIRKKIKPRKIYIPEKQHPWRRFKLPGTPVLN